MDAAADQIVLEKMLRDAPLPLVAARIKRARKSKGWSHDRMGDEMGGVFRQTLIGYEKGQHRPRLSMLLRLAEVTEKDPRWFVDEELDPSPFPAEQEAA